MCIVDRNILIVGIGEKGQALRELPIRVLVIDSGRQAIEHLRQERIDALVSSWELIDLNAGKLLKNVKQAKPSMPTIAFIKAGNIQQEIEARTLGVDAVLSEDIDDDHFREVVCQLLGISAAGSICFAVEYEELDREQSPATAMNFPNYT